MSLFVIIIIFCLLRVLLVFLFFLLILGLRAQISIVIRPNDLDILLCERRFDKRRRSE
jgi:hypothetical protein